MTAPTDATQRDTASRAAANRDPLDRHAAIRAAAERLRAPGSRVVAAMSGGVDSSAVAWMLAEAGHEVVGLFMRNGVKVSAADAGKKSCCSVSDARDARMVAAKLGIPFQAVDLAAEFASIVDYFVAEYRAGRTPNPCVVCNRDLKFDKLLDLADELGATGVATGHYARIAVEDGRVAVRRGVDRRKDQSYQLLAVAEEHLARTLLPLGELEKPAVRALAERAGLRTASKPDSQEICFVPGNDYRRLLEEQGVALRAGPLVDTAGNVLGEHAGVEGFTIGQRRGHGVGGRGEPLYVVDLVPESATVVLGNVDECRSVRFTLERPNWIGIDPAPGDRLRLAAQVRNHHRAADATARLEDDGVVVELDEPQLAVAPGQGCALYDGDRLVGGGWIAAPVRVGAGVAAEAGR